MICKNCGQEVQEGDAFCQNCGSPVTVEEQEEKDTTKVNLTKSQNSEENSIQSEIGRASCRERV